MEGEDLREDRGGGGIEESDFPSLEEEEQIFFLPFPYLVKKR